ncbi:TVP38/TMEM64 family protein [Reyranella sp. CPCC 100927]|uniref:TVP38/TMEM64 family protein n=1 Tax=Reyranella sp. CPCC 100927 TaxID=2599616 RepID=UPI0011B53BD6|nr:TVP38/TMEM64 family protein [Reyranella sp. CPCC 100927]TWT15696.1 TVP38/TMEM64 family protein [Reyranella sp. CPCC 100927]
MAARDTDDARQPTVARWRRWLPLLVLAAGLVLFFAVGLHKVLTFEALRTHRAALAAWVSEHYVLAALLYVVLYAALVAFSLPLASLATLVGGWLFGAVTGTGLTVLGATSGAIAVFLAARSAAGDLLRARADSFLGRMESGFRRNAASYLVFLRLVPVFPFWLVNIASAIFKVPLRTYALTTFVGIIPGTAVYCSVGAGLGGVLDRNETPDLKLVFEPQILLPLLALACLSLVPMLYDRWKTSREARR